MTTSKAKKADYYNDNDEEHSYLKYWQGRDYEDASEQIAIRQFLKGKHFKIAADIGGGYGRLCLLLEDYADQVNLVEPSHQQLDIAVNYLNGHDRIKRLLMQADDLKFADGSIDLLTMVRVMHHLPDPSQEFRELSRVLSEDGYLILELANYAHFRNRLKHLLKGSKLPKEPVDIRSKANRTESTIAFVNHNPKTVIKQLAHAGLKVDRVLSVSNLRSPALKRILPMPLMLSAEKLMQMPLAKIYFGPSIFFLVRKVK